MNNLKKFTIEEENYLRVPTPTMIASCAFCALGGKPCREKKRPECIVRTQNCFFVKIPKRKSKYSYTIFNSAADDLEYVKTRLRNAEESIEQEGADTKLIRKTQEMIDLQIMIIRAITENI